MVARTLKLNELIQEEKRGPSFSLSDRKMAHDDTLNGPLRESGRAKEELVPCQNALHCITESLTSIT